MLEHEVNGVLVSEPRLGLTVSVVEGHPAPVLTEASSRPCPWSSAAKEAVTSLAWFSVR
jgi:hypothetical protein